jgi:hypothetical protein
LKSLAFKHQSNKTNQSFQKLEQQDTKLEELMEKEKKIEELFTIFNNDFRGSFYIFFIFKY